ncbi:hypothetical protein C1646_759705 [Rhizophagus diaphanus]|nr:hypothetical protein C1646_759705 [Rhizophagus diaphanus] [Rhizophagus sp. MUCL 43196]
MFKEINKLEVNLIFIVTDSASSYAATRRRLQLKYVHITFLPCFLQTLQKESYGKYVQIAIENDTRWNSYYECFCTLIKSKGVLQTLGSKFKSPEQSTSHQSSDIILYLPDNISSILHFYLMKSDGNHFQNL